MRRPLSTVIVVALTIMTFSPLAAAHHVPERPPQGVPNDPFNLVHGQWPVVAGVVHDSVTEASGERWVRPENAGMVVGVAANEVNGEIDVLTDRVATLQRQIGPPQDRLDELVTWASDTTGEGNDRLTGTVNGASEHGAQIVFVLDEEARLWVQLLERQGVVLLSVLASEADDFADVIHLLRANPTGDPLQDPTHPQTWLDSPTGDYLLWKEERLLLALQMAIDETRYEADRNVDALGDRWAMEECTQRLSQQARAYAECRLDPTLQGVWMMGNSLGDFDGDGLGFVEEFRWGLDPMDPDGENDGWGDGLETAFWSRTESSLITQIRVCADGPTNTCSWRHPDAFRDSDGDGCANTGGFTACPDGALGDIDSEDDGVLDGIERFGCINPYGTNEAFGAAEASRMTWRPCTGGGASTQPEIADSDFDGLSDASENQNDAVAGAGGYRTDPNNADTDDDSMSDGDEASYWGASWKYDFDYDAYAHFSNLHDEDADRDGLLDGAERLGTDTGNIIFSTDPRLWDSDQDGMPDPWEIDHGLDPTDARDAGSRLWRCASSLELPDPDPDGDGLCNVLEYEYLRPAGWNEYRQGPFLSPLDPQVARSGDADELSDGEEVFNDVNAGHFAVHASTGMFRYYRNDNGGATAPADADPDDDDLDDASEVNTPHPVYGRYTNPNDPDSDGDGLDDDAELTLGTDPAHWDTDGDTDPDGSDPDPFQAPPPPPACASTGDCDNDGLQDSQEVAQWDGIHCVFGDQDSDNDGLWDGWEVNGATPGDLNGFTSDCLHGDTDGDGLSDDDEVQTYRVNPRLRDTDGDELNDKAEIDGLLNSAQGARHTTRGWYSFALDRCRSPVAARCVNDGSTDPGDADSDDDGIKDGREVFGVYKSSQCEGALCQAWVLNPNLDDTDGDSPTVFSLEDKAEASKIDGWGCRYDPADYDTDRDHSPDGSELFLGTNGCSWDTDRDHLGDGEEANFLSDPLNADSDGDGFIDFADPNPAVENQPPLILSVKAVSPDWRYGVCVSAADEHPVAIAQVKLKIHRVGIMPGSYEDEILDPAAAKTARWEGDSTPHLCVRFSYSPAHYQQGAGTVVVDAFELTVADVIATDASGAPVYGSQVRLSGSIAADPSTVDFFEIAEAALCFVPGWGTVASLAIGALQHDNMKVLKGGISGALGATENRMLLNGQPLPSAYTAFKLLKKTLCVFSAAKVVAELAGGGTYSADLQIRYEEQEVDRFLLPPGQPRAEVFLIAKGQDHSTFVEDSAESYTAHRGAGLTFLQAKYPEVGDRQAWNSKLLRVFQQGTYSTAQLAQAQAFRAEASVDGRHWSVLVYGDSILDVAIG